MAVLNIQNPDISLTKKQKLILDYVEENPQKVAYTSLKDLSRQLNVSEVSILHFCKKVGAENFVGLKQTLQNYISLQISDSRETQQELIQVTENNSASMNALCNDIENINQLSQQLDMSVVNKVAEKILSANKVYTIASGITFYFADYLANRLRNMGINATAINVTEIEAMQSAIMSIDSDAHAILMSFPPYLKRMKNILALFKERNVAITTITDTMECPAVSSTGDTLLCCVHSNHIWNSHTTVLVLINILSAHIGEKMGDRLDDVLQEKEEIMEKLFL